MGWGRGEILCLHNECLFEKFSAHRIFFLSELNSEQVIVSTVFFLWTAEVQSLSVLSITTSLSQSFPEMLRPPLKRKGVRCLFSLCFSLLVDTKEEPAIRIQCNMCNYGIQRASRKLENRGVFLAETWRWTGNCSGEPGGGGPTSM